VRRCSSSSGRAEAADGWDGGDDTADIGAAPPGGIGLNPDTARVRGRVGGVQHLFGADSHG